MNRRVQNEAQCKLPPVRDQAKRREKRIFTTIDIPQHGADWQFLLFGLNVKEEMEVGAGIRSGKWLPIMVALKIVAGNGFLGSKALKHLITVNTRQ